MKLISWNVNGLRACVGKGFFDFLSAEQPDMMCLQETKLQPEQAPQIEGYHEYWNSAEKKGYSGFTDTFRHFYPDLEGAYSWWSYRFKAREKNAGWRIDYFLVSDRFINRVKDARILSNVFGSDHCPVMIEVE